jgi:hypothetical protein
MGAGTIGLIITALSLAAKYEPIVEAAAGLLIPALRALHASKGDQLLLADIDKLFHAHGMDPAVVASVLPVDISVGNAPAQI